MTVKNVAIIGGGVSGLGVAYYLNDNDVNVTVYEAVHHVGGNCRTVPVPTVGQAIPGGDDQLKRWVDIGVNDFNLNSYENIVDMLKMLKVEYAPLEDTISFFGNGNCNGIPASGYTMDTQWGTSIPETIKTGNDQFAEFANKNMNQFLHSDGKYYDSTIGEFLSDPEVYNQYPELKMGSDFVNYNLFPHINAMYFATGIAPSAMPARMVMHYFHLQEGYGTGKTAERMYWVNGSHDWIQKLADYLTKKGVTILERTPARFKYTESGVSVLNVSEKTWQDYDAVVLGVQAKQLTEIFDDASQVPDYITHIQNTITYSNDEVVVHGSTAELPANVSAWRTYNVNVYEHPDRGQTYRMTYVINRHQNDIKNPKYNFATDPQFFCSLNPRNPIPKESYLAGPKTVGPNCTMFNFYHTILGIKAQECQDDFIHHQQGKNNIWLVGGYTCGTGLQEECWIAAQNIAEKMLNPEHEFTHLYNRNKKGAESVPLHIRQKLI